MSTTGDASGAPSNNETRRCVPALRLRGAYLAVTTLAFSIAISQYFLNPRFFAWVPDERVERNPILGVVDWSSSRAMYYVALVTMVLQSVAVVATANHYIFDGIAGVIVSLAGFAAAVWMQRRGYPSLRRWFQARAEAEAAALEHAAGS